MARWKLQQAHLTGTWAQRLTGTINRVEMRRAESYASIMNSKMDFSRREWLVALAAGGLGLRQLAIAAQPQAKGEKSKLSMPGLYPGRVVAVSHPACITEGKFQSAPIQRMMEGGMLELTDAEDGPSAWRLFFERGDIVGIKVNPVGAPHVRSEEHTSKLQSLRHLVCR